MIIIYLPSPPSLNKLWNSTARGRVRSPAYRAWAAEAGWEVKRQYVGMAAVDCRFNLEIHVPVSRRDTGNWEKAIGDLLESVGIVTNDGNCHELIIRPMDRTDCLVIITPLPEMGHVRKPAAIRGVKAYRKVKARPSAGSIARAEGMRANGKLRF